MRSGIFAILLVTSVFGAIAAAKGGGPGVAAMAPADPCPRAASVPAALRLPATVPPGEPTAIELRMLSYLLTYRYQHLGWCVDKRLRDTGPFLHGKYFGTHPAVRILYSPEMIAWLRAGKRGAPPDGAVIIKEQYAAPAARWAGTPESELHPTDWTIMIRRGAASRDGWFWAELFTPGMTFGGTQYPNAGFGLYCLRCHASAADAGTFSSLANIRGFPGEPLVYRDDGSWRAPPPGPTLKPEHEKNLALIAVHTAIPLPEPVAIQTFPAEPLDAFVQNPSATHPFVTSNQCTGCHSASTEAQPFGPVMWLTGAHPAPAVTAAANVSEYGEWRWSPMALAGRDPVFYAQLASELQYLSTLPAARHPAVLAQEVVNTCTQCHNAMGKRTFAIDRPKEHYSLSFVFDADPAHRTFSYGGLARDGISCAVCHHAVAPSAPPSAAPLAYFLEHKINGTFDAGPANRMYGPFHNDAIATHAMDSAVGAKPVFSKYVTNSQLCGSCHTIDLPVVDTLPVAHDVEQNTYVEWINSRFQTEYRPQAGAKSCQDCHMSAGLSDPARGIDDRRIVTKIALVQDDTYPRSDELAPVKDVHVRVRKSGFRRHTLLGLNAFLLETFKQFPDVLGVRLGDYMTGQDGDIAFAIDSVLAQARRSTATVAIFARPRGHSLVADVTVTNLTGHRFPSGVGFRRAFLDVEAFDANARPRVFFASGRTDPLGRIVGEDGNPLPSESFARGPDGRERYQVHHDTKLPITNPGEAQIFEELTQDAAGNFTTSFIRRDHVVKDNRILPQGWRRSGQPGVPLPPHFLEATLPHGRAATDPNFTDGKGRAIVRYTIPLPPGVDAANVRLTATLYYQSWAPYFIAQRTEGNDPASRRLRALLARLRLDGTPLAGWKLRIASASSLPEAAALRRLEKIPRLAGGTNERTERRGRAIGYACRRNSTRVLKGGLFASTTLSLFRGLL